MTKLHDLLHTESTNYFAFTNIIDVIIIYILQVIAEDSSDVIGSGSFPSSATVTINLINVNEGHPQFVNAPYNVSIMENSNNGTLIVMVTYGNRVM